MTKLEILQKKALQNVTRFRIWDLLKLGHTKMDILKELRVGEWVFEMHCKTLKRVELI